MNKGLALTITNQTDTVVLTDKERILQIGNNLLSNAIKFTENGGVSLTMDYNNGALKLIVEDTGTGMTDEEQQRVFGAFERLSNAHRKRRLRSGTFHRTAYCDNARRYNPAEKRKRQGKSHQSGNTHADSRRTAGTDKSNTDSS